MGSGSEFVSDEGEGCWRYMVPGSGFKGSGFGSALSDERGDHFGGHALPLFAIVSEFIR